MAPDITFTYCCRIYLIFAKVVIVAFSAGQLCNRLFHFSYFIANAIEYQYTLVYPYFDNYKEYFPRPAQNDFLGFPVTTNILPGGILNEILAKQFTKRRIWVPNIYYHDIGENDAKDIVFDLNEKTFTVLAKHKILVVNGWLYRDAENVKKYKETIKKIFEPQPEITDQAEDFINRLHIQFECVVGVHIRRGDYKDFLGGRYYYHDDVYYSAMKQVATLMQSKGKQCVFLIASNDRVETGAFHGLNICYAERDVMTDLYLLSKCDYLIGPPSTFSFWASFYGEVPLHTIDEAEVEIREEAFIPIYGKADRC